MTKKRLGFLFILVTLLLSLTATPALGASKDTVRVWVAYQSGKKAEVFQALGRANANVNYDFPELDAYVVTLPAAALNGIQNNPFVVDVEEDAVRYPIETTVNVSDLSTLAGKPSSSEQVVPWGVDAVQARQVWDANGDGAVDEGAATGAGVTVCIIDTGYYQDHEDLKNAEGGVSQVDASWSTDGYGHGTHVAGTITADNNALGVVGVTPGTVNLFIVKIFDNAGAWTRASDLTAAIYSCRDNGADIISMSLGGTTSNRKEKQAFDSLYAAGILHVAASGNEQVETPYALSYPAAYDSVISVAAVDSNYNIADFSNENADVELAAPGVGVLSTLPYTDVNTLSVAGTNYSALHVEYSARGTASGTLVDGGLCDATSTAWTGQVVLCQRGSISFYEKVMNVQNSGGAAAIIYNNTDGALSATLGDGYSSTIIAISLTQADGLALVGSAIGQTATVSSVYNWPASGYEAWDGTSMATPHVAGVAALVWSAYPNATNVQIRQALTETAIDLGTAGRDIMFGYGLVQAKDAIDYLAGGTPTPTQLVASVTSPAAGMKFSLNSTVTITVQVTDGTNPVSGVAVSISVSDPRKVVTALSGTTDASGNVTVTYNTTSKRGTYTITATATLTPYVDGSATATFSVK